MADDFIKSILQANIASFTEKFINQKRETLFKLNCMSLYTNKKWSMEKLYSDFENLSLALSQVISDPPELSGKSLFQVTSFNGLTERQYLLQEYLHECCLRKDIISTDAFSEFLDLEKQAPELLLNRPTLLSEFNKLPLSIQDFIYLEDDGIIFLACSDMELKSRIEAYITNTNLPWESKEQTHISVGAFFAFKVLYNPDKGFKFEKLYAKSFQEQTGCISWNKTSNTIHIGLDSGKMVFFKLNPDSNFTQYEQYIEFKPHKDRVTGIMYDAGTGYIYSVGADKKFYITEIGYLNNPSEILDGPCGFTGLYEDMENQRVFLTNELGMVLVYLTQSFPPLLVNSIQLSSEAPIKSLDMSLLKSYIFTACDNGQIIVLDINKPGKEKLIKEISNFGGNMRLTVVKYYREQNQLITGDENGRIIIWNLKIGKSIFSWNAHEGPITQMVFMPQIKLIISAGKDKYFRTWRLPEKWQNDDVVKFEQSELKNISDMKAMLKLQKNLSKPEEYNSDEDSLNGWDYNDEFDP